jgi:DNA-nicking Smr family endonuclease
MAKKRQSGQGHDHGREDGRERREKPVFNSPFKDLKKLLKEHSARPAASASAKAAAPIMKPATQPTLVDDAILLRQAFEGVRPLDPGAARIAAEPARGFARGVVSEDAEVLAELSDLISGQGSFELTETEEYVEGARAGLDPRLVTRLRRGEFSVQGHLDLHGMTQIDAKEALTRFILDSVRKSHRTVLVVHGRGLRSPGGQPVLKHATAQWLSHGTIGGYVLAFVTARANDGGAGAVLVLLRRERQRAKFDILQGAKRRD